MCCWPQSFVLNKTFPILKFKIRCSLSVLSVWLVTLPTMEDGCSVWMWHGESVSGVTVMEGDQNRSSWARWGGGWRLCAVCFWINTLFLSCSVSYLIGWGIYYHRLIALQPAGTRPSASGRICTCVLSKTDRAQTQTTHESGDRLLGLQSWLSPEPESSGTLWVSGESDEPTVDFKGYVLTLWT